MRLDALIYKLGSLKLFVGFAVGPVGDVLSHKCRSEGFLNGTFAYHSLPVRDGAGALPNEEGCWDVDVTAVLAGGRRRPPSHRS